MNYSRNLLLPKVYIVNMVLQMGYLNRLFYPLGQGAATVGRWRLPTEAFYEFTAPYPPEKEQNLIFLFIENILQSMSKIELEAEKAIKLMQERRTALISAAVTGKIDVRNFVSKDETQPEAKTQGVVL